MATRKARTKPARARKSAKKPAKKGPSRKPKKSSAVEPVVESLAISVPRERAWEALTGPGVLGDILMGHVEMDARPGGAFAWHWGVWARAAPASGSSHAWRGHVLDAVPGSTLVLSGGGSTATLTVKGEGGASLVTVVHVTTSPGSFEDYQYGWADFLLRLKTRLERPALQGELYLRTLVRAKPADVLRTFLDSKQMAKLLPGKVKITPKPGGRFEWTWTEPAGVTDSGQFLEIAKGHRIAFTWEGTPRPTEVRVSADTTPYGAMVALEHLGMSPHSTHGTPGRGRQSYARMWAHLLERIRCYFYFGKRIRT
ncbi:MAG TPA: SRPBCC domain-containing protein [Candidatus Acidoferrales bacterium]